MDEVELLATGAGASGHSQVNSKSQHQSHVLHKKYLKMDHGLKSKM